MSLSGTATGAAARPGSGSGGLGGGPAESFCLGFAAVTGALLPLPADFFFDFDLAGLAATTGTSSTTAVTVSGCSLAAETLLPTPLRWAAWAPGPSGPPVTPVSSGPASARAAVPASAP